MKMTLFDACKLIKDVSFFGFSDSEKNDKFLTAFSDSKNNDKSLTTFLDSENNDKLLTTFSDSENFSVVDNQIFGQTFKDRNITLALFSIIHMAQKGELISLETYKQVAWERDIAISQLEEIGKSLGEKMDDVKTVITAKWIEKRHGYLECTNCGHDTNKNDKHGYPIGQDSKHNKPKYCPHCGALMIEE